MFESEYAGGLYEIGRPKFPACSVTDVKHVNLLAFLQHAVDHAINVRFLAVE